MMKFFSINNKKHTLIIGVIITVLSIIGITINSIYKNNLSNASSKMENTEVELDNWEISTVFYDSTVDGGVTPLTEINWDASNNLYTEDEERTITIQINYKNNNTITNYKSGELQITIPNLIYKNYDDPNTISSAQWETTAIVGANDGTHSGYEWNFFESSPGTSQEYYIFNNSKEIEEKSNLEGSIQIIYKITSLGEDKDLYFEKNIDECTHSYTKKIQAELSGISNGVSMSAEEKIISNELSFNYIRKYSHPWKQRNYTIKKSAEKIVSLDGLPSNEYWWVKYKFTLNGKTGYTYPYVGITYYIEDTIPEDCLILDRDFNEITLENNVYKDSSFQNMNSTSVEYIYVGYPKDKYNIEKNNLNITNDVELFVKYGNESEYKYTDSDSININLSDYEYEYPSILYNVSKEAGEYNSKIYSNYLLDPDFIHHCIKDTFVGRNIDHITTGTRWDVDYKAIYTGTPMTIKAGDDIVYITSSDGSYRRLADNEYWFQQIYLPKLTNLNNQTIKYNKYPSKLFVRYAGDYEYTLYTDLSDYSAYAQITFSSEKKVVAYYIQIEDAKESLVLSTNNNTSMHDYCTTIHIKPQNNILSTGKIYNYNYLQVYFKDENDNLTLQNKADFSDYLSFESNEEIAQNDVEEYGFYVQRGSAYIEYYEYTPLNINYEFDSVKYMTTATQDINEEKFYTTINLQFNQMGDWEFYNVYDDKEYLQKAIFANIEDYKLITKYHLYDLLPKGMELESDPDEILNNIYSSEYQYKYYYTKDGQPAFSSKNDMKDFLKKHSKIIIKENWKDTGRTKIEWIIDFSDTPLFYTYLPYSTDERETYQGISFNVSVSYDSLLEYGNTYDNYVYGESFYNDETSMTYYWAMIDNGEKDKEATDINENGKTTEEIDGKISTLNITSVISTHQDLTTYVKTSESNYSTGTVETEYGSEYEYKLRVRTGSSEATNLIIYTNLEETNPKRISWKGEFLGIDTSYAESKGYTVKTYYSEKIDATNLLEDASWKEYNDSIDKTKVKSLAFQYLDSNGNPAILPVNSLTYILIIMKAPSDENIKAVAYNNSWTEWNAIDPITEQPVDYITGINSNTVKVSLPNSIEPETIEIKLEKKWADNNNKLGLRPDSIKYNLIINGNKNNSTEITLYNTDINVDDENIWFKYIEADKYDEEGNIITYTIEEELTQTDNIYYVPSINNYSITNTLSKDLTINKKWLDNNNAYVTRPTSVIVKVLQNNEIFKEIEITGELSTNEWTKTISVPIYDENGNEYKYTFEEQSIDGYTSSFDSTTNTFTNTLSVDTSIIVTKNWKDNTNKYGLRPSNININIKQNNQVYKTISLSGTTDTWKSEELTIPMYDKQGIKYNYTIEEETVKGYGLVEYNQETLTITNTLKETITLIVTKNWIDDSNSSQTRPTNLSVTILQNNKEFKTITLSGNTNTWTSNIEVPKYDENQNEYTYTIKENNENIITEYSDVLYGEDGLTVTNKLNKNIDLTITKKWKDFDNEYLTRPDTVTINLYRNNILYQELTLIGENNSWSTKVTNVPAYDDNGKKYIYTIEEVSNDKLSKYEKITYDQTTLTVTNEILNPPKVTLYFTVQNGYTEAGSDEVKFDEEGYKKVLEKYNINGDEDYTYTFELQNVETGEIYKGQLTTSGVLTFENISYGTYRAIEGEDEYFDFVEMLGIVEIPGVSFKEDENGGIITIKPTGEDITYGVNIINKIEEPASNPNTTNNSSKLIIVILSIILCITILVLKRKFLKN